ncbi:uncharacterized protein LOC128036159 [Gossypium raimondii]|uniref:uncharacterized protein LOC128036159 n=1 Tax=Gossypium raimondii TaxID=29730 RepID=UPI00227C4D71|nr:uncharacterized protein LOC128036159 [Gossypium raimondii]
MAYESPKQAWDRLKKEFQGTERMRQQQLLNLRRNFKILKMKEEKTVKQYSDRIMVVVNSIKLLRDQFSEGRFVEKVISTLPERYEAKISSLEDSRDLNREKLAGRRSIKKVPSKPRADLPRAPLATKGRRPGQTSLEEMEQEKGIHLAHIAKGSVIQKQIVGSGLICSAKSAKGWAILIRFAETKWLDKPHDPNAAIFKNIDRSFKTRVKVGNGHFIKVKGKRDVLIDTPTGTKLVSNILFMPEIDRNLLSIAQLLEKGYSVVFKGKERQIRDLSGSKLMSMTMADRSFVVDWNNSSDSAYTVVLDKSKLWHKRLGHDNYKSLVQLTKGDLVENFSKSVEKEDVCEAWKASEKLQLLHTNVYNPMKIQSLNGSSKKGQVSQEGLTWHLDGLQQCEEKIEADQNDPEMNINDVLVRGTRPLAEIYERTDVAAVEPSCFEEAEAQ